MPFEPIDRMRGSESALIYRGKDPRQAREGCVKIFKEPYGTHSGFVNECENVANVIRTIKHPNLIQVWEVGRHSGRLKISTELMPMSLREYMVENETVDLTSALSITLKIIEALEAGYNEGLEPHLAIKPNNILVNDELTDIKLADWYVGRAMEMMDEPERKNWEDARYLSPEQIHRIGELTFASDIYSLGMVLCHMLTGFPIFHDADEQKVRYQQVYTDISSHIEYYRQIPAVVKEILITTLQKDPSRRYGSLTEFKEAVAYALAAVSFKKTRLEGSLVGEIVDGKYEIVDELGSGQFSIICKAVEKGRDKFVTIKIFEEKLSKEEGFIRAINKDLFHRAQLKHPQVTDIISQGWFNNRYFIVETFVPSSLASVLADRGKLAPEQALKIVRKIIGILDLLCTKGMLKYHGELAPDHVLINPKDEEIFLRDFHLKETSRFIRATFGIPMSSYHYMAPEVLLDEDDNVPDQRADIYSLGCLLYRLVSGEVLFDGSPEEVLDAHLNTEALPKIQEKYEIPLVFHDILIKMLEKDPANRYQTFEALAEDIDQLIGGSDSGISIQLIDQGTNIKGKYRLEDRMLNVGGVHGLSPEKDLVLYSGIHLSTDTPVMLWFYRIPKTPQLDEAWTSRMKKAVEFNHPGLLRVLDYGRDKGAYFFVSELRSHTIADHIAAHGPFTEPEAVELARQIIDALKYLSSVGVEIFGRLSPESVFVVSKPQLKAKLSGIERDIFYSTPTKLNRIEYLSPEQITGLGEVTPSVDIYAWGLLMYYMITGKDLFEGEAHEIAGLHVYHDPRPELEAAQISADLRHILERALKKDYNSRYSSLQELIEDLDDYQANIIARETEEETLSFIPGAASFLTVVGSSGERTPDEELPAMTFAMRYPASSLGIRGAFGVTSGIAGTLDEALKCGDMALREAEKVFAYSSISRLDILDNPNQLAINAMQRANGVINQEAFRVNKIGAIGAEMVIATISHNRLFLARVGSGFAYLLRANTIRTFLRRPDEKRMLGRDLTVQVETTERQLRAGDVLIIGTSDLGRILSDVEIRNTVTSTIDSQEAAERIISLAGSRYKGSAVSVKENMACVIVQFGEIVDSQFLAPGRFPAAPVIHHYVTKGTAYLQAGLYDKAIDELVKGLEIKPDSFSVNFQLALAYKEKGQLELALRHCRKALDLFPGFAEGHVRLGDILYERGDHDKAREEYEMAVAAAPNSAESHNALGTYYYREALYSYAIKAFRKALELDPSNAQAKANLENSINRAKSISGVVAETASKIKHGLRQPLTNRKSFAKKKKKDRK